MSPGADLFLQRVLCSDVSVLPPWLSAEASSLGLRH